MPIEQLTVGSLFSGIGGFELGLERAGMRVIWNSEIDPYASAVLRKHYPDIPNHGDIRTIDAARIERPDVLCGGFPCQDISNAGKRAGIDGEQSGLWEQYARLIDEIRPLYAVMENVSALLGRGLERVLGDLAAIGYDAEWHCIPASAVGAPHRRDRIFIMAYHEGGATGPSDNVRAREPDTGAGGDDVAYTDRERELQPQRIEREERRRFGDSGSEVVADAERESVRTLGLGCDVGAPRAMQGNSEERQRIWVDSGECGTAVADTNKQFGRQGRTGDAAQGIRGRNSDRGREREDVSYTFGPRLERLIEGWATARTADGPGDGSDPGWWLIEPDVGRVAHGVPSRVDRLRCLGNAIVPQVAEIIGRAIIHRELFMSLNDFYVNEMGL